MKNVPEESPKKEVVPSSKEKVEKVETVARTKPAKVAKIVKPPSLPEALDMQATATFLSRTLPKLAPQQLGLSIGFCDLHVFFGYLESKAHTGYLHLILDNSIDKGTDKKEAVLLLLEGRIINAASADLVGAEALSEFIKLYETEATVSSYVLPEALVYALSGVSQQPQQIWPDETFSGVHFTPVQTILYQLGQQVLVLASSFENTGSFAALAQPKTLILPPSLAGWAHHQYQLTLRGKDALSAITSIHQAFRRQYGTIGLGLLKAINNQKTPAEYVALSESDLNEIEALLKEFTEAGLIKEN